jgi:hypothetical protein
MNLDKTIKELTDRLNIVHPYSSYSSISHQNSNDGVNYWKGKKIISVEYWNDIYKRNSTHTDAYKITLTSRIPLQYFPDDYNGSISSLSVIDDELKEAGEKWNKDYYELLEYRKNSILGKRKCTKCLLSGSNDDPIFIGIEKVIARIVSDQCNNNNSINNVDNDLISYPCKIMNFFQCPFESKENNSSIIENNKNEESKYQYKREDLFTLHQISFAIEQAITTFFEIPKQNEIIFEVDFENDRIQEIHTNYNGEPESWGWQKNVKEQLSKVKPISNIKIRDEQDIYNILTNREKLEYLFQEYEKEINHQLEEKQEELELEYLKPEVKAKMKDEFKQYNKEQIVILKENKQKIIDFLLENKDSIRIDDLKIYEPIYKCYRQKGNCIICNTLTNIICINCKYNKEVWLCTNNWNQHAIKNHAQ